MKITRCVPLAGGDCLVARHGDLVVVAEAGDFGPDPLLDALDAVSAAAGDGMALVLEAARAVLEHAGPLAGACAGVTADGEVAILVHRGGVATVSVDGGPEVAITAGSSMIPVSRAFAGTTVTVCLTIGGPMAPDPRLRLDGGVVHGGGLMLIAAVGTTGPATMIPDAASAADAMTQDAPRLAGVAVVPDPEPAADVMMSDAAPAGNAMMPDAVPPAGMPEAAIPTNEMDPVPGRPGPAPGMPRTPTGPTETWFSAGPDAVGGSAVFRPQAVLASPGREPKLHQPAPEAHFKSILLLPQAGAPDQNEHPHDHVHDHAPDVGDQVPVVEAGDDSEPYAAAPALVEGVLCARNHFNDPNVQYCRQCGISMVQLTRKVQRGQRPPLGVLLLDDGTGFTLDKDYVLGREPVLDGDVAAGRARPLRISDPDGTVSRLHLRISLVGWQVEVRDLGSANGSVLYLPAGERKLAPYDGAVIEPGARIGIGHRSIQYLSYRAG
jgi:hypothetical protein